MTAVAFGVLLLATVGWVVLPLVPALRELFQPTDVEPLTMVGRDNADISRFARHFRDYAESHLSRLAPQAAPGEELGVLPDGTPFVRVSRPALSPTIGVLSNGSHDRLVVTEQPVTLKGGERFRLEIWARSGFSGGPEAAYRAILGEDDVSIGAGSTILRWVHARGALRVDDGSTLFGRTSSDREIRLGRDIGFERLGAPVIRAGSAAVPEGPPPESDLIPAKLPDGSRPMGNMIRVTEDFVLPPHGVFEGNLVVAGTLRLAPGARIRGNVKARGDIVIERGAVIEGSAVSGSAVILAGNAWVKGPVIAEGSIELMAGASVGARALPTTVSGKTVSLDQGAAVCGHIVAQEGGHTTP